MEIQNNTWRIKDKMIKPVNCGIIKAYNMVDPIYKNTNLKLEVLYPQNHIKNYEIVCYYFIDEQGRKIEITISRNIKTRKYSSEVYYFKGPQDLQHYTSRCYPNFVGMPKKYYDIVKYIHVAFVMEFGN